MGDKITVKASAAKKKYWQGLVKAIEKRDIVSWLDVDKKTFAIAVKATPAIEEMQRTIAMNLIIEFYSR